MEKLSSGMGYMTKHTRNKLARQRAAVKGSKTDKNGIPHLVISRATYCAMY